MEQARLEELIAESRDRVSIHLFCEDIASLPESIGNLINLTKLSMMINQLRCLPESIGNLTNLIALSLNNNQLTSLPSNLVKIKNLDEISIGNNPLTDLSLFKKIPKLKTVYFLDVNLPSRYWCKLSDWEPSWLLDERNVAIRSILIEHVGYEKICDELNAITLDTWREYTLLKIDGVENTYGLKTVPIASEPMVLLKMTCPSTAHIHILRVPPEMDSAEAAITWVNHGIHPDKFSVQT